MSNIRLHRKITSKLKSEPLELIEGVEYEYFPNGIFKFNITKLIEHIDSHSNDFELVEINVKEYFHHFCNKDMNPDFVALADLSSPLILAEIAPDRLHHGYPNITKDYYSRGYNLIDGHHRLAKADREGVEELSAYVVRMEQHIPFMVDGFDQYMEYWNSKLG